MKSCLRLLFLPIALLLPIPSMAFCNRPQPRLVCAEYFASQLVVEATLIQTDKLHDKNDPEGVSASVYILRVNQTLRGKIAGTIRVYEGNDSGRAPFDWLTGREYLLLLFYAASEKSWELDGCGNSGPVSKAKMALSEITSIKSGTRWWRYSRRSKRTGVINSCCRSACGSTGSSGPLRSHDK